MKEIEVKAKVKDFKLIIRKLEKIGCKLSKSIIQKDTIFVEKPEEFDKFESGKNILRIRQQNDKTFFTLKKSLANELDSYEREVKIDDAGQLKDLIGALGFEETVRVNKEREKCKYKDMEICLDKINGLGNFIEVEKLSTDDSIKIQKDLFGFLQSIGVKKEDRVTNGYDTLIYRKKKNK